MGYVNIAWNNLLRNRRRTLSTLSVLAIGVSMIVVTNGFTAGISANMADSLVNQIDGHLRIQHRDYKKYFITDQEKIWMNDARLLAAEVMKNSHARAVMPRVMLGGLIGKDVNQRPILSTRQPPSPSAKPPRWVTTARSITV